MDGDPGRERQLSEFLPPGDLSPTTPTPLSLSAEGGLNEQTEPEDLSIRCGNEAPPTPLLQSPHTRLQNTRLPDSPQQNAGTDARDGCCLGQRRVARMEATCSVETITQAPQNTRQEGSAPIRRSTPPPSTPAPPDSHCMAKLPSPGPDAESQHVRAMQALATRLDARPSVVPVSSGGGHLDTTKPVEYSAHSDPRDTVRLQQLSPNPGLASGRPLALAGTHHASKEVSAKSLGQQDPWGHVHKDFRKVQKQVELQNTTSPQ
ncbi:uncharacterized protein LOC123506667 isoform X2 [Portunus trituberculatus]|uniref:uncharacterized protein LOC123506667 isoform X2 n=1 Tax=Portunus trituberculatus TaxID=210409 RepID=UPI001E1D0F68|nr:uncharacterized protein LOC123506667 isoform X2 [Portunus trituberculatus]